MENTRQRASILAHLLFTTSLLTQRLLSKEQSRVFFAHPQILCQELCKLKNLLINLMYKSEAQEFSEKLAKSWQIIHQEAVPIRSKISPPSCTEKLLKKFFSQVNTFPTGEDHSLGFYLSKYGQDEWTPLPFLLLLKNLHDHHPDILRSWISLIEEILEDLLE
ncbi:MAG: hypothetical protein FJZ58_01920 [Chlamydiae bacterium]|nr:hypothetical protein [Chlamydiota bacterium]